jgi:hypothetical protein
VVATSRNAAARYRETLAGVRRAYPLARVCHIISTEVGQIISKTTTVVDDVRSRKVIEGDVKIAVTVDQRALGCRRIGAVVVGWRLEVSQRLPAMILRFPAINASDISTRIDQAGLGGMSNESRDIPAGYDGYGTVNVIVRLRMLLGQQVRRWQQDEKGSDQR